MSIFTRNKILLFIIILLLATNTSTLVTIWHNNNNLSNLYPSTLNDSINKPPFERGRYFRDQLNLSPEQFKQFKQVRQQYFPIAHGLKLKMYDKRIELLNELSKEQPDTTILNHISKDIGDMHTQMKIATNNYFIKIKNICSPQQQKQLIEIFNGMLNHRNSRDMPRMGKGNHFKGIGRNSIPNK